MKLRIQVKPAAGSGPIAGGAGAKHVLELSEDATAGDLARAIEEAASIHEYIVRSGFPPKALDLASDATVRLATLGVKTGASLIVEVAAADGGTSSQQQATATTSFATKPARADVSQQAGTSGRYRTILQDTPAKDDNAPPSVPVRSRGVMTVRVQPDDNSCLFRSIGYVCMRSLDCMTELRSIVTSTIRARPAEYPAAVLGMATDAYCARMARADTWGGEIEMKILSDHFGVQLAAVDCKSGHLYRYNEHLGRVVYIAYSGIHYDAVALARDEHAPPDLDTTEFASDDRDAEKAVVALAKALGAKGYYTDTASFALRCNDCGIGLKGEKQAQEHAMQTRHVNFGEYR